MRARREGTQDKIFGALISLLMQMKFVGMSPPWSSAQSRAARQMEVTALAQPSDSARFFATDAKTLKTTAAKTTAATTERSMMGRLLMAWSSGLTMKAEPRPTKNMKQPESSHKTKTANGRWFRRLLGGMDNLNKSVKIWRKHLAWLFERRIHNFFGQTIASFIVSLQLFVVNPAVANPYIAQVGGDVCANQTQFRHCVINLSQCGLVKLVNGLSPSGLDGISPELVHQYQKLSFLTFHVQDAISAGGQSVNDKPSNDGNDDGNPSRVYYANWLWYHFVIFYVLAFLAGGGAYAIWYFTRRMPPNVES